jgi:ankyrin repeat protein
MKLPSLLLLWILLPALACKFGKQQRLVEYATKGDTKQVISLVDSGVDVNGFAEVEGELYPGTALIYAAAWGRTEIVRALIDRGADILVRDDDGRTALDWAREADQNETAGILEKGRS